MLYTRHGEVSFSSIILVIWNNMKTNMVIISFHDFGKAPPGSKGPVLICANSAACLKWAVCKNFYVWSASEQSTDCKTKTGDVSSERTCSVPYKERRKQSEEEIDRHGVSRRQTLTRVYIGRSVSCISVWVTQFILYLQESVEPMFLYTSHFTCTYLQLQCFIDSDVFSKVTGGT